MGPEVLQALRLPFGKVEGGHPQPGRRLALVGVDRAESGVPGDVEHLSARRDVDVLEEPGVDTGRDVVHQRRPRIVQVLVLGHRAVQGPVVSVQLLETGELAGPHAVGEIEDLPQRADLDHVHVGEGPLEVGLRDTAEGVERVAARGLVLRDEALLDQKEQQLLNGVGLAADGLAQLVGGHAGLVAERVDDAELETGQQVHEPRGAHHVFAETRECRLWCHCTHPFDISTTVFPRTATHRADPCPSKTGTWSPVRSPYMWGCSRPGNGIRVRPAAVHVRSPMCSWSSRVSSGRRTFKVAVRGRSDSENWTGSASWGRSVTAERQRSRSSGRSPVVQITGIGSACGPDTTISSVNSSSLPSRRSSTSSVLPTSATMSTSRSSMCRQPRLVR